jgi:hypothetical protein
MVRWKGYGPEHNKWVKHSDVFAKDTIDAYYRRYPNAPRWIALAAFDSLPFRRHNRTIHFIYLDTVFQGGMMPGEPPLWPLWPLSLFQLFLLWTLFQPMFQMVIHPPLQMLLCPSICPLSQACAM